MGDTVPSPARHWLDAATAVHSKQTVDDVKAVWRILAVFVCLPPFWMLFDQQYSSWVFLVKRMDLMGVEPEQVGVLNSMLVPDALLSRE